jgi:protein SCO1
MTVRSLHLTLCASFGLVFAAACVSVSATEFLLDSRILAAPWRDNAGKSLSLVQLTGKPLVMTMGYAACRKTCSTTLLVLKEIQKSFEAKGREAEFVVVTYAPDADTPKAWTEYRKSRDLARPNWHFLSGTAADTRRVANMLDLNYWSYDEHVMHDFRVVIFDADGKFSREIRWPDLAKLDAIISQL